MTSQSLQDGVSGLVKELRDAAIFLRERIQHKITDRPSLDEREAKLMTRAADALESQSHQSVGVDDAMVERACAIYFDGDMDWSEHDATMMRRVLTDAMARMPSAAVSVTDKMVAAFIESFYGGQSNVKTALTAALSPSNTGEKT